jgi:tetratricopeptide (TPR) repeat protein
MITMKLSTVILLLTTTLSTSVAFADLADFQLRWATANYSAVGEVQEQQFEALIADIGSALTAQPDNPELLIWKGIIESTYAGKVSGLSALGLVKSARDALETAININPNALQGSAYTSLGALYYQVPSWPIAFGSDKKARRFLTKALEVNPDGIDSNYFYGAFLYEEEDFIGAKSALERALQAPARPDRQLADKGRREEIRELLAKLPPGTSSVELTSTQR